MMTMILGKQFDKLISLLNILLLLVLVDANMMPGRATIQKEPGTLSHPMEKSHLELLYELEIKLYCI